MSLQLVACAGPRSLQRVLLLGEAVSRRGGRMVVLTYTPGLTLRTTSFALEVVVRREDTLTGDLLRLEALALSRGAHVVLLDDHRLSDEHAPCVRVLSQHLGVACYGPPLAGGAAGELTIDPFWPSWPAPEGGPEEPAGSAEGCLGLSYLPLHPGLRALRERRTGLSEEVQRVTIASPEGPRPGDLALLALSALSVWRPTLQVTVLCAPEADRAELELLAGQSRHQVTVRSLQPESPLGEEFLCDLAIVGDPEHAALAAYLGTPVVVLSRGPEAARCCESLARQGVAVHVPEQADQASEALSPALFADMLWNLCADQGRRAALSATARRLIDGLGTERIATALCDLPRRAHSH